jgi:hypothetical protein
MVDGPKIMLGGVERVFAPLNFKALRRVGPRMGVLTALTKKEAGLVVPEEAQDLVLEIVLSSLRRNYPEVSQDEVEEHLDFRNVGEIMTAIMGGSGLHDKVAQPGEEARP